MRSASKDDALLACHHCGASFRPRVKDEIFCCTGCRFVHDLIEGEGFSDFYRLLGNRELTPLNDQPINQAKLDWLKDAAEEANGKLSLQVANLSCTACVWLVERLFRRYPGGLRIGIDINRSTIAMWWTPGEFDVIAFAKDMHRFGYPVSPYDPDSEDKARYSESQALLTRLGVTAGLALNTMAFSLPVYLGLDFSDELASLFRLVTFASATLALAVGGSWFFRKAWISFQARVLHMDVPIALGLLVAYIGSLVGYSVKAEGLLYFDFVATFVSLMLLGRWLHIRLIEKNRSQLKAREQQITSLRRVARGESEELEVIKPEDIQEGDELEIGEGSLIPVRGNLLSQEAAMISLDWINGEPEPISIHHGEEISAGARNASGSPLRMIVCDSFAGSLMEKLLATKPEVSSVSESVYPRLLQGYLLSVIVIALAGASVWLWQSSDAVRSLQVLISVLVVSCPCALGLALPLVDEILNSRMRRHGIFVRANQLWQKLPGTRRLVFDKTGTLTESVPRVNNPEAVTALDQESIAALSILIGNNPHPHAAALREILISMMGQKALEPRTAVEVEELPSYGVQCEIDGVKWRLGKADWATTDNIPPGTVLSRDRVVSASFEISESIREGAAEEIQTLQNAGYHLTILSGDPDRERVLKTASALGISPDTVYSAQTPDQKAAHILREDPEHTLFVGDGGNDSLALDSAVCTGTPATGIRSIESRADFVFMGRNFRAIRMLLNTSKRRRKTVHLIFFTAVTYNVIAIAICLAGMMNPLLAAVLMPLSSLLTTIIAART